MVSNKYFCCQLQEEPSDTVARCRAQGKPCKVLLGTTVSTKLKSEGQYLPGGGVVDVPMEETNRGGIHYKVSIVFKPQRSGLAGGGK